MGRQVEYNNTNVFPVYEVQYLIHESDIVLYWYTNTASYLLVVAAQTYLCLLEFYIKQGVEYI